MNDELKRVEEVVNLYFKMFRRIFRIVSRNFKIVKETANADRDNFIKFCNELRNFFNGENDDKPVPENPECQGYYV